MWFGVVIENGCDKRKGPRWDVQMRRQEEWRSELFVLWEEDGGVRTNQVRRKSSSRWAKRGISQHYVGNWCRTQVRVSKKDKCSEQSEFSHLALRCREATLLFTVICYNASKLSQGFVICDWPHTYLPGNSREEQHLVTIQDLGSRVKMMCGGKPHQIRTGSAPPTQSHLCVKHHCRPQSELSNTN